MTNTAKVRERIVKPRAIERFVRWLDAMPHPSIGIEIAADRIAAIRYSRTGAVEQCVIESLPPGTITPSAVEVNITDAAAAHEAMARVSDQLKSSEHDAAVLLPDPVARVFIQTFEQFPKSSKEALPFLRWKLKKSVPFDIEDTTISFIRQPGEAVGADIVSILARIRVVREYEELVESVGWHAGVVMSSPLAALSLLEGHGLTLLARVSNTALTTAVIRDGLLFGYRCTELPAAGSNVTPQLLQDEIYPLAAHYRHSLGTGMQCVCLSGIGQRFPEFAGAIENEFGCQVQHLLATAARKARIGEDLRPLIEAGTEGLLGWMMNRDEFFWHFDRG